MVAENIFIVSTDKWILYFIIITLLVAYLVSDTLFSLEIIKDIS